MKNFNNLAAGTALAGSLLTGVAHNHVGHSQELRKDVLVTETIVGSNLVIHTGRQAVEGIVVLENPVTPRADEFLFYYYGKSTEHVFPLAKGSWQDTVYSDIENPTTKRMFSVNFMPDAVPTNEIVVTQDKHGDRTLFENHASRYLSPNACTVTGLHKGETVAADVKANKDYNCIPAKGGDGKQLVRSNSIAFVGAHGQSESEFIKPGSSVPHDTAVSSNA